MKTNLTRKQKGAILCLALFAAAIPFAALAQAGTPPAPNGANPRPGVGMNPFQRPQVDDGPTDGKDHPNYHISTPIKCRLAYSYCTTIDVSARIDRQAGFRLEGTTLSYQNYSIDPEKSADAAPVLLFGGKFAEDVSVNGSKNKWTNLLKPFRNAFASQYRWSDKTFDPSFDTDISFQPGGCEITVVDHAKSLEVIATNPKAEPARFRFDVSNGDPSFDPAADRKKHDEEEARKDASRAIINPRPATEATSSTDGTAHPNTVAVAPVKIASFAPEQKIVIRGTVDQICGFQIKGNTLSYLNSKATTIDNTGGFAGVFDASKLIFRGKYASGVTVNGEPWTCLNRPVALNTTLKDHSAKHITFRGPSCSFQYRKCGDAVAFFIGNYDKNAYQDKPSQFEIVLYFADEPPVNQP